jgi:glycosyltransferase involved in cell wall biosynthesis
MRVAFLLHLAKRDGAGHAFLELLDGLKSSGVEAFVLVPGRGPLLSDVESRAAAVAVVPYRWWLDRDTPWWKKILRCGWNLAMVVPVSRAIRRWGCRIVYSNTLTVSVGALAAKRLRLPHVWHVHELWGGETGFEFDLGEWFSLRLVNRLSDACIANSQTVAGRLGGAVGPEKLHVVYQSVTLPKSTAGEFSPVVKIDSTATACLIVGSLHPIKRQEDAVRAVALLKRQGLKVELWLVGDETGPYVQCLRRLAALEDVEAEVRFLGFRENPLPLLQAADLVLSCSPVEAFGRASVEAMLVGKAVVAARGGGNNELVQEGFNGLLYESGDCTELARCIRFLVENPGERERLGANARGWAESRFSAPEYGQTVLAILESTAVKNARARRRE